MTRVVLIAAVARNGVIGRDNDLPWRLPEDLQFFRRTTMGHPVLMGRRNWDSLPARFRPLPGRHNIVLTRNAQWRAEGATPVHSLEQALDQVGGEARTLYVIGGAELYRLALPLADEIILTELDRAVEGDVHFPGWNRAAFEVIARQTHAADSSDAIGYERVHYRKNPTRPA
jgi:dihydrofolate reductase